MRKVGNTNTTNKYVVFYKDEPRVYCKSYNDIARLYPIFKNGENVRAFMRFYKNKEFKSVATQNKYGAFKIGKITEFECHTPRKWEIGDVVNYKGEYDGEIIRVYKTRIHMKILGNEIVISVPSKDISFSN